MLCYSCLVDILMYQISYYLDESSGWDITIEELQRALDSAREHCQPRALVVINPSNPTGRLYRPRKINSTYIATIGLSQHGNVT